VKSDNSIKKTMHSNYTRLHTNTSNGTRKQELDWLMYIISHV